MSDFDKEDVLEELPAGQDFDQEDVIETVQAEPSKLDSLAAGAASGITLNNNDEIGAGLETAMDLGHEVLNKLGLSKSKSPRQVNKELAAEGVKGDVGPQSILDVYRQARDENRVRDQILMDANPKSYIAGNILGGIATAPLMPGASIAKGATVAQKALTGAQTGAQVGAIAGLGNSEADITKGDLSGAIDDTAKGAAHGTLLGAAIPLSVEGVKAGGKAVSSLIPDNWKTAYKFGKKGVKVDDALYEQTKNNLDRKSMEIVDPIMDEVNKNQAAKAQQIAKIDDEINQLNLATERAKEVSIAKQNANNAKELNKINRGVVEIAKNVQKKVQDVKTSLGKEYNEIDELIEATGVFPENREIIGEMVESLKNSNLKDSLINSQLNKYQAFLDKKDMQSYRNLKAALNKDMNSSNLEISRPAKQAYMKLRDQYTQDLINEGQDVLAARLGNTNKRWNAVKQIEDNFLDDIYANSATGQVHASNKTINTIQNSLEKNPKGIAETEELAALLKTADSKAGNQIVHEMQDIATQQAQIKNAEPLVLPQGRNPDLERLQGLMEQAKALKPDSIKGLGDIPTSNPEVTQNSIINLIKEFGARNVGKDIKTDRIVQFLNEKLGPEQTQKIMKEIPDLAETIQMFSSTGKEMGATDIASRVGVAQALNKNAVGLSNIAGRVAGSLPARAVKGTTKALTKPITVDTAVKAGAVTQQRILKDGSNALNDASDEQIDSLNSRLEMEGPEGQEYSRVLQSIKGTKGVSRIAKIHSLMQQPKFRELLKKVNGGEDEIK